MSTENAPENELGDAVNPEQMDEAIDGLRDVLKQDAEGLELSSNAAEADGGSDLGAGLMDDLDADFGGDFSGGDALGDLGADFSAAGDLGSDFSAGADLGSDFGGGDLGADFGGGDLGADFGGGDLGSAGGAINDFDNAGSSVTGATGTQTRADLVLDIPIDVQVVLGTSRMQVSDLMDLSEGATIGLDRKIGEPVEIMVNGKLIGRGEITVLENDDAKFGVKMIEVMGTKRNTG